MEETVTEVPAPEIKKDEILVAFDRPTLIKLVGLLAKLPIADALDIYAGLYSILNKKDSA